MIPTRGLQAKLWGKWRNSAKTRHTSYQVAINRLVHEPQDVTDACYSRQLLVDIDTIELLVERPTLSKELLMAELREVLPIGVSLRLETAKLTSVLVVGSVRQSLYWQVVQVRRKQ